MASRYRLGDGRRSNPVAVTWIERRLQSVMGFAALALSLTWLAQAAVAQNFGKPAEIKPPETFFAIAQVSGQETSASAQLTIHIQKYTDERDRTTMAEALKVGGYPGFLPALRKAPEVGYVEAGGRKATVRWA